MATRVSQAGFFTLQALTDLGALAVGGRIYTYTQGTTTKKNAYTEATGTTVHTYTSDGVGGEYIALNARGELPAPLYLTAGAYDITYKTAAGATVWTRRADPIADSDSGIVSVSHFSSATAAASAIAAAGTGTVIVPNNVAATLPATYVETVFDYQSQLAHNVYSESDSGRLSKKLMKAQHGTHTGTQQVGVVGLEFRPTGSGFNGAANADIGYNISVIKKDYLTTSVVGEIDGMNIAVRNGGTASSDCAGILVDIANLSGSGFMAAFEAASTSQNSAGVTQKSIQSQVGVIDSVTSVSVGFAAIATAGAVNDGLRLLSSGTGNWENFLRFFNVGGTAVFKVDQYGRIVLTAESGVTPSKTIRALDGSLSVLDDAGTTQILTLTDLGGLSLTGGISVGGGVTGTQLIATSAATAAAVGSIRYGSTVSSSVGAAGAASVLPANPLGYIIINVAGTSAKVPYYTA